MRLATDVGGTFTDLVTCVIDPESGAARIATRKVDSTPPAFEKGVLNLVDRIEPAAVDFFAHGSTVVINALLARTGAKTALITTRGFRDVLEIARGNRPDLFNFYFKKPKPFVPRHLRLEPTERTDPDGRVLIPAETSELPELLELFKQNEVEAVAVCFLHAYANPANELATLEAICGLWPDVTVVGSHTITREWREYERTSTTVLSAYVKPVAARYLHSLASKLRERGVTVAPFIMQSNGGIGSVEAACENPISMVESGPASGVLGAIELARLLDEPRIVSLDIGGTTAKCALINELQAPVTTEYSIEKTPTTAGYPIKTPVIELVEIGSGGGSIARIDEGGKLHVGPDSAGAVPGPAVFGRGGTLPTTTDAQVLTRRLDPNNLLGGEIASDLESCERAFEPLVKQLDLSLSEVARGVLRVANANMTGALRLVSVNKGYDPRDFTLVAFGGGGALHAAALGQALSFRKVIVPLSASVFSAWGMLVTDLRRDYLRTRITTLNKDESAGIHEAFEALADEARADFATAAVVLDRYADLRYRGQEHTVKVPFPDLAPGAELLRVALERFHTAHERAYSYRLDRTVELVNLHLVARVKVESAKLSELPRMGRSLADARRSRRNVDFDELGSHEASIYDRALLEPEMAIQGPAVIEEPASTCVVPPGLTAIVDTYGNLHIAIGAV